MRSASVILFAFIICASSSFTGCSKGSSSGGKQKVVVEMQVGYDPRVTAISSRINFYFTRTPGVLVQRSIPGQLSFDTTWTVYLNSGDTLKMIDPSDSLFAVFLVKNINNTKPTKTPGGSLEEFYVQP